MNTQAYIEAHKDRFMQELFELLRIKSVSTDSAFADDVRSAAEFVKNKLEAAGVDKAELCETAGHPIVYAEKIIDPAKPTVLVYGHYDVQPPDPLELWESKPFEPEIRDGKIYARGASDDKGQMYMHIKSFEAMHAANELLCNIKFLFEGEEESGSINLEHFIEENKEKLTADMVLISDTTIIANDMPSITVGLRGIVYLEVKVTGPSRDLHSGVYGGAIGNPANIACKMIASLKDENNRVTIPGFYDDVAEASAKEREGLKRVPFDNAFYQKELNVGATVSEAGFSPFEGTTIRPTLDVNGMISGYTGEGGKTVLPAEATIKFSMRLVPNQSAEKIAQLVKDHLQKIAPSSVKIDITQISGDDASVTPIDSVEYKAAAKAMAEAFGKEPVAVRCGGSIPVVGTFQKVLGIQSVLMGFALDSDSIHSPNEHFGVWNFYKGIETIPLFYKHYSKLK